MRTLLVPVVLLASLSYGQSPQTGPGAAESDVPSHVTGVMADTCWTNSSGNTVEFDATGGIFGMKCEFTEGDNSGTCMGTPNLAGGVEASASATVGSEEYRVDDNGVEWKNPNGDWIDMTEVECEDDDEDPAESNSGTIGSLPLHTARLILLRHDEVFVSLPA